jgi:hypothetical protein
VNFGENTIAYPYIFDADLFFDGMPSTLTYCAGATIESSQLASAIMVSPHSSTMPGAVYPNIASDLGWRRSLNNQI